MYSQSPRTFENISKLIDRVRELGGDGANELSELLESVNDFLASTKPEKQVDRDRDISEHRIAQILKSLADALNTFAKLNRTDKRSIEIFELANKTIKDRLDGMREKNDKIFLYFSDHADNPLRTHFPDVVNRLK